jgi:hypothetical protein
LPGKRNPVFAAEHEVFHSQLFLAADRFETDSEQGNVMVMLAP